MHDLCSLLLPGVAKRPYTRGEANSKGAASVPLTNPQLSMRVAPESVTMMLLISDYTSNSGGNATLLKLCVWILFVVYTIWRNLLSSSNLISSRLKNPFVSRRGVTTGQRGWRVKPSRPLMPTGNVQRLLFL